MVRWVVSSVEEFRRVASRAATFMLLASIPLVAFSIFVPHHQVLRIGLILLYLVFAVIVKVTIRRTAVNSLSAIQIIEKIFWATVLTAVCAEMYSAWADALGFEGLIHFVAGILTVIIFGMLVRKNIMIAKSMVSRALQ